MPVLESDDYRKTREALKADPIIQAMAAEIQEKFNLNAAMAAFTHNGTRRGQPEDGDGPTFDFMTRCLDEYHKRGGEIGTHIGGPAEAILMILKEGQRMTITVMTTDAPATLRDAEELGLTVLGTDYACEWPEVRLEGAYRQVVDMIAHHSYKPRRGPVGARSRRLAERDIKEALRGDGMGTGFSIAKEGE